MLLLQMDMWTNLVQQTTTCGMISSHMVHNESSPIHTLWNPRQIFIPRFLLLHNILLVLGLSQSVPTVLLYLFWGGCWYIVNHLYEASLVSYSSQYPAFPPPSSTHNPMTTSWISAEISVIFRNFFFWGED